MTATDEGWAAGEGGAVVRVQGGQATRIPVDVVDAEYMPDLRITKLDMVSATEGWAIGTLVLTVQVEETDPDGLVHTSYPETPLLGFKNGVWTRVKVPGWNRPMQVTGLSMASSRVGWALGAEGGLLEYRDGVWTLTRPDALKGATDIQAVSEDEFWAFARGGGTVYHYRQGRWDSFSVAGFFPSAIAALSSDDLWAVAKCNIARLDRGKWLAEYTQPSSIDFRCVTAIAMSTALDGWAVGTGGITLRYQNGRWTEFPNPTRTDLNAVATTSPGSAIAVGAFGTVLRFRDGRWEDLSRSGDDLFALAIGADHAGWAVGAGGAIYRFRDGELTDAVSTPYLLAVAPAGAGEAWAVGKGGVIGHYQNGTWALVPSPTTADLQAIAMVSPNDGWAVGGSGTILRYQGGSWQAVASPTTRRLNAVVMSPSGDGMIGGDANTLLRYQAGAWKDVSSELRGAQLLDLTGIAVVSPTLTYAVSTGGKLGLFEFGSILKYDGHWGEAGTDNLPTDISPTPGANVAWGATENGKLFMADGNQVGIMTTTVTSRLTSVSMTGPANGWAVGARGAMLQFDGADWTVRPGPVASQLESVRMRTADEGFAVGAGTFLHFADGAWQVVFATKPTDRRLLSVAIVSDREAWAVGDGRTILHYVNGTWTRFPEPVVAPGVFSFQRVAMIGQDDGWIAACGPETTANFTTRYGGMLRYRNGAWQWTPVAGDPCFVSIAMVSATEGFAHNWEYVSFCDPATPFAPCAPDRHRLYHLQDGVWSKDASLADPFINLGLYAAGPGIPPRIFASGGKYLNAFLRYEGGQWVQEQTGGATGGYSISGDPRTYCPYGAMAFRNANSGMYGNSLHFDGRWLYRTTPTRAGVCALAASGDVLWGVGMHGVVVRDGPFALYIAAARK